MLQNFKGKPALQPGTSPVSGQPPKLASVDEHCLQGGGGETGEGQGTAHSVMCLVAHGPHGCLGSSTGIASPTLKSGLEAQVCTVWATSALP